MIPLSELTRRVALDTGIGHKKVSKVVRSLVFHIGEALAQDGQVRLDALGHLTVIVCQPQGVLKIKNKYTQALLEKAVQFRVSFRKAPTFKRRLKEEYGGSHARKR